MGRMAKFGVGLLVTAAALALIPARAAAQAPPGPLPPKPGAPIPKAPVNKDAIRVRVDVVTAPVVVRDEKGEMVEDLEMKNFHLFDNGVEQVLDHFDMGADPLSVVLLIENSSRVAPMLPAIRKSGIVFTQDVVGADGEAAVIAFGSDLNLLQPFTYDHDEIERVIRELDDGGGQTRFYDALSAAVRLLHERPPERRRVIVAITEATDRGSGVKLGIALREAELENITIYTVGLSTTAAEFRAQPQPRPNQVPITPQGIPAGPPIPGEPQSPTTPGIGQQGGAGQGSADLLALAIWAVQHGANLVRGHALEVATTATGGVHLPTMHDRGIEAGLDRIGGELHAQYTLSYHPAGGAVPGFHEIKITVDRPKTTVRTRTGYYLQPLEDAQPNL